MSNDESMDILETVTLSRTYELVLARDTIGLEPALKIMLRHTSYVDGRQTFRGGFSVFAGKIEKVLAALDRARHSLEQPTTGENV